MSDSTCLWPDCEKPKRSKGFCPRDYARAKRANNFEDPWVGKEVRVYGVNLGQECRWPDCENAAEYGGLCRRDYSRAKRLGNHVDPWNGWDTSGTCETCGKSWESGRNLKKGFCSATCRVTKWRIENPEMARASKMDAVRRRRARMQTVEVDHFSIAEVRANHGSDCYICGKPIDYSLKFPKPNSPSLDHVQPLSLGGSHTLENVAMTHLVCNLKKHAAHPVRLPQAALFAM